MDSTPILQLNLSLSNSVEVRIDAEVLAIVETKAKMAEAVVKAEISADVPTHNSFYRSYERYL